VGSLTLISKVLLNSEVNYMIVRLDAEHVIIEDDLTTGVLTFLVKYAQFHYFSIVKSEPLAPGTEPFTRRRLCSGIIFKI
jgi:hypothetical protein